MDFIEKYIGYAQQPQVYEKDYHNRGWVRKNIGFTQLGIYAWNLLFLGFAILLSSAVYELYCDFWVSLFFFIYLSFCYSHLKQFLDAFYKYFQFAYPEFYPVGEKMILVFTDSERLTIKRYQEMSLEELSLHRIQQKSRMILSLLLMMYNAIPVFFVAF